MPLTEEAIKLEYLRKHNIPQLLDSIVLQLLEWQPEDPVEYIRNSENLSARAIKSVASSFRSVASSKRVRTASVDSQAMPTQISLSPKRGTHGAKSQQAKSEIKKVKAERKRLFDSYRFVEPEGGDTGNLWDTRDAMQCVHIGCIALAVNYLMKRQKHAAPASANIGIEDVFYHSRLPLYYMNDDSITLAELYEIVKKFIENDIRTQEMSAAIVRFDATSSSIIREDEGEQGDMSNLLCVNPPSNFTSANPLSSNRDESSLLGRASGVSANSISVKLPPLRRLLEKRSNESNRAIIMHFDPHVATDGSKAIASYGENSANAVILGESDDEDDDGETSIATAPTGPAAGMMDARLIEKDDGNTVTLNKLNLKTQTPAISVEQKQNKGSNSVLSNSNSTRNGVSAVFVDINPARHVVTLAEVLPIPKKDTISLQYMNISLPAMYMACSTTDWYSSRSRGFVEISNVPGVLSGGRSLINLNSSLVSPASPKVGSPLSDRAEEGELPPDRGWNAPLCVERYLMEAIPECSTGIPLISVNRRVAAHVIAVAWGINILTIGGISPTSDSRKGIDIGDLMLTVDLPVHAVCNPMPLELVFGYCSNYLQRKFGEKYMARQYLIFVTSSTASGSISTARSSSPAITGGVGMPSMSVMRFEQYLNAMMTLNQDPQRPNAVMLLNFDACLGVDFGMPPCSNWAILSSYDKNRQVVQLADTKPKRNGYVWHVELSALHAALVNKGGFILLLNTTADFSAVLPQSPKATARKSGRLGMLGVASGGNAPAPETSRLTARLRPSDSAQSQTQTSSSVGTTVTSTTAGTAAATSTTLTVPASTHTSQKDANKASNNSKTSTYGGAAAPRLIGLEGIRTFEFSSPIFCPTVVALAFTLMGGYILYEDLVQCGIDITFLLSDHITLHDIARCALYMTRAKSDELGDYRISVRCMDRCGDGNPRISVAKFTQVIEDSCKDISRTCVVVNFDRRVCHGVGVFTWQQVHSGGTYGVVVAYQKETQMVTVCDLNPVKYYRTWMVPLMVLYNACSQTDSICHRARGYIVFESSAAAVGDKAAKSVAAAEGTTSSTTKAVAVAQPDLLGRHYDIRKMITSHPFKQPTIPQLTAVAFAITELEKPVSVEDVYYAAYEKYVLPVYLSIVQRDKGEEIELNYRFSVLRHHCSLEDMSVYAKSVLGDSYPVSYTTVDASQSLESFEAELRDGTTAAVDYILVAVFQANVLYDIYFDLEDEDNLQPSVMTTRFHPCNVGAALVKHYNPSDKTVVLAEVNPTRYGVISVCTVDRLRMACSSVAELSGGLGSSMGSLSVSSHRVDWLGLLRVGK